MSQPNDKTTDNGAIVTGGTAQYLFDTSQPVHGYSVTNVDATNDLWVAEGAVAVVNGSGSIKVPAGGGYESPAHPNYRVNGSISIIGATTGTQYTARKW